WRADEPIPAHRAARSHRAAADGQFGASRPRSAGAGGRGVVLLTTWLTASAAMRRVGRERVGLQALFAHPGSILLDGISEVDRFPRSGADGHRRPPLPGVQAR